MIIHKGRCARCREKAWPLVTDMDICLPCVEQLLTEGGKWSAGDDGFLSAARIWHAQESRGLAARQQRRQGNFQGEQSTRV